MWRWFNLLPLMSLGLGCYPLARAALNQWNVGDSITYGIGDETLDGGWRGPLYAAKPYIVPVGTTLDIAGFEQTALASNLKAANGEPSWTTAMILAALDGWMDAIPAIDAINLSAGTNDISIFPSESAAHIVSIVSTMRARAPSAHVLVYALIGTIDSPTQYDGYNAAQQAAVASNFASDPLVTWVDRPLIPSENFQPSPPGNGLHPNHAGYLQMAQVRIDAMNAAGL